MMKMLFPRLNKETSVFKEDAIADGIADAGSKATSYVTDITGGGIMVHPSDDSTSGWKIASAIELLKSGVSYIKMWLDGSTPKLRLGRADKAHVTLADSSMDVSDGSESVASFGSTARIGKDGSNPHFLVNPTALEAYDANGKYFTVSRTGMSFGSNDVAKSADIPTKVSELANDSSFATTGQVGTAKSEAISAAATDATTKANAAAKTATSYVTDITGGGIMVHPSDDSTSGWKIADALELLKSGVSYIKVWVENSVSKMRVGVLTSGHGEFTQDGLEIFKNESTSVAKFGSTSRIGTPNGNRTEITQRGVDVYFGSKRSIFLDGGYSSNGGSLQFNPDAGTVGVSSGYASVSGGTNGSNLSYIDVAALLQDNNPSLFGPKLQLGISTGTNSYNYARLSASDNGSTNTWVSVEPGWVKSNVPYTVTSDRRLKTHKQYLSDESVDFVRALKPAIFEKDAKLYYGFYAQDVKEADHCGTAIVGEDSDGHLFLDYSALIAPLVAYCHMLEKRIEALEGGE